MPCAAKWRSAESNMRRATSGFFAFLRPLRTSLESYSFHLIFGVPVADGEVARGDFIQLLQISLSECHVQAAHIFREVAATLRSRDWNNVVALRQHPSERQLRRRAAFCRCHLFHAIDQRQIFREIRALTTWGSTPKVIGREIFELLYLPREEAAAERAERHESDAQFATDA